MENNEVKNAATQEAIEAARTQQIAINELQEMHLNPDSSAGVLGETAFLPEPTGSPHSRIPNLSEESLSAPLIEPFSGALQLAELTGGTTTKKKRFFGLFKSRKSEAEKLLEKQEELKKQAAKAIKNTEKQIAKEQKRQAKLVAKEQREKDNTLVDAHYYTMVLAGIIMLVGAISSILLFL